MKTKVTDKFILSQVGKLPSLAVCWPYIPVIVALAIWLNRNCIAEDKIEVSLEAIIATILASLRDIVKNPDDVVGMEMIMLGKMVVMFRCPLLHICASLELSDPSPWPFFYGCSTLVYK